MRLKARPADFRVVERLDPAFLGEGPFAVYRAVKSKWTTLEALARIAREARVEKSAVAYAGMKDRQGIAVQHFSVAGGERFAIREEGLVVGFLGTAPRPISPEASRGNAFEIVARALDREEVAALRENLEAVRAIGLPNYFDDQRFGCLRHGQGFVARDLIEGEHERGLRALLASASPFDDPATGGFKAALRREWGRWERCAAIARPREHFSLFRHLAENPRDFRGAFAFVAQRLRVLHLHAYQSFLWNRGLADYLRGIVPYAERVYLKGDAGALPCPRALSPEALARLERLGFPLPAHDSKVEDPAVRRALEAALGAEGLTLDRLRIEGIPGFAFKAETRQAWLRPAFLRVRPAEADELSRARRSKVTLRFELPRGAYATLLLKRLFAPPRATARPRGARAAIRVSGALPPAIFRAGGPRVGQNAPSPRPTPT